MAQSDCCLYSHPISECIQEAGRNDSHHHQPEDTYICICETAPSQISPCRHLSKMFVLNLLLSDIGLSGCANSLKYNWSAWPCFFNKKPKNKSQAPLIEICACLLGNILKFSIAKARLKSLFFCTGDLGIVDCGGDLLSQRKRTLVILWCGDTESGLACQQCGGVNPQSLCQTQKETENMRDIYMIYSSLICKPENSR